MAYRHMYRKEARKYMLRWFYKYSVYLTWKTGYDILTGSNSDTVGKLMLFEMAWNQYSLLSVRRVDKLMVTSLLHIQRTSDQSVKIYLERGWALRKLLALIAEIT